MSGRLKIMARTEEFNLKEEVKEEIKNILKRGIDNERSSIFRVMRKEQYSPRGMAVLMDNDNYEMIFYESNLDGVGGLEFTDTLQKARQILVLKGKELESNKEMVRNLKKTGNIYSNRK